MKKLTALLLAGLMILSLTACSAKEIVNETLSSVKEDIDSKIDETIHDIGQNIISDVKEDVEETVEGAVQDAADDVISNTIGHDPSYWAEYYHTNRCPFYINTLGIDLPYYFRDGGDLDFWVYTEDNTSGWYINDGYIISADNAFGIQIEGLDSFSSCCTYEAKAFAGNGLEEEERKAQRTGAFYVLNSYTPVRTQWGVQLVKQADITDGFEVPKFTLYGLTDSLYEQEWFRFYIMEFYDEYTSEAKLWAFEHKDRSEYPEILSEDFLEKGAYLGEFAYDSSEDRSYLDAYIPNKDAGGFEPVSVDLVMTYGDENVTVGVINVVVVSEEN